MSLGMFDSVLKGVVTGTKHFGAFISIDGQKGQSGLCPIEELGLNKPNRDDNVYVRIIKYDNRGRPIFSLRGIDQKTGVLDGSDLNQEVNKSHDNLKRRNGGDIDEWELSQMNSAFGVKRQQRKPQVIDDDPFAEIDDLGIEEEEEVDIQLNTKIPKFLNDKKNILINNIKEDKQKPRNKIKERRLAFDDQKKTLSDIAVRGSNYLIKVREKKNEDRVAKEKEFKEKQRKMALLDPMKAKKMEMEYKEIEVLEKKALNDWREQSRSQSYGIKSKKSIQQQRESLPVFNNREKLLNEIRKNDFIVIVGETGSGKSTQLTQYLAEDGYINQGIIACTQPRRVAATSVAKRVAEEVGCKLGNEVGYTIRFDDCTSKRTMIKYMTDGMLEREALVDPDMNKYSVIMLDEAHERTIATDILFALLRDAVIRRKGTLKVIVTSATLDADKFSRYFNNCPIFNIQGRTFPVKIYYSKTPELDYIQSTIETVVDIHLNNEKGDILVFLTGREEIETCCESIIQRMSLMYKKKPKTSELIVLPIFSAMPSEMQSRIFEPTPEGKRKVVIATNIAETSITIDGIFYVIDPGFVKVNAYDPKRGMDRLIVQPISQAQANQRSGRAGRTGPGMCYRLYTKSAYMNEMEHNTSPEILRQNLANTILMLKAMGIDDVLNFGFMDRPKEESMIKALEELYILDALDENGKLTKIGKNMSFFPMEPLLSKTLIKSFEFGCSYEVIEIISMLSVPEIFYRPKEKRDTADRLKRAFDSYQGDHLTLLKVYREWEKNNYSKSWCEDNFIQEKSLRKAKDVKTQLLRLCSQMNNGEMVKSCDNNLDQVVKAFVSGFFKNSAKRSSTPNKDEGGYKTLADDIGVDIHPSSALFGKNGIEYVIYHTLIMTTKEYMQCTTRIDPKWLVEYAPKFFRKANGDELSISKKREKIQPLFNRHDPNETWRMSRGRR